MNKRNPVKGMILMTLALTFLFASCSDTWTPVTEVSQMDGRWKGTFTQIMSVDDYFGEGASNDLAVSVKISVDVELTINVSANTYNDSSKIVMAFSGKDVNAFWDEMSAFASYLGDVDNSKKTITMESNDSNTSIPSNFINGFEINQNGKKFRQTFIDDQYIIMKKQ